ncbi:DUF6283 family protein [Nonomuraea sp. GTA35]|uniref:DUF6283 family protein n=1 Tax=Nonomuraea sp. GTA35 TaxID=1676746 RepID=UPI0035C001D0
MRTCGSSAKSCPPWPSGPAPGLPARRQRLHHLRLRPARRRRSGGGIRDRGPGHRPAVVADRAVAVRVLNTGAGNRCAASDRIPSGHDNEQPSPLKERPMTDAAASSAAASADPAGHPAGPPAKSPCGTCPFRRDAPSGMWSQEEFPVKSAC